MNKIAKWLKQWFPLEQFIVVITQEHLNKSSGYEDCKGCALATALKEQFPSRYICVGGSTAHIGLNKAWSIDDGSKLIRMHHPEFGKSLLPTSITLTRIRF